MATATLVLAGGLAVVGAPSASAAVATSLSRFGGQNPVAGASTNIAGYAVNNVGSGLSSGVVTVTIDGNVACASITPTGPNGFFSCAYTFPTAGSAALVISYHDASATYADSTLSETLTIDNPPTITLGTISAAPVSGTASSATVLATTSGIMGNSMLGCSWVDGSGNLISAPTGLSLSTSMVVNNRSTVTFTVLGTAVAGSYRYKIYYQQTIAYGNLVVDAAGSQQSNNSSSSSSSDASAAIAAAAKAAAEQVAKAKSTLVETLKAGKPITAADLNAADITVASSKAAERVNAKVQALPESKRTDLAMVKNIVQQENFVEKVSISSTQFR